MIEVLKELFPKVSSFPFHRRADSGTASMSEGKGANVSAAAALIAE